MKVWSQLWRTPNRSTPPMGAPLDKRKKKKAHTRVAVPTIGWDSNQQKQKGLVSNPENQLIDKKAPSTGYCDQHWINERPTNEYERDYSIKPPPTNQARRMHWRTWRIVPSEPSRKSNLEESTKGQKIGPWEMTRSETWRSPGVYGSECRLSSP